MSLMTQAIQSDETPVQADPAQEYLSGGSRFPLRGGFRSLASRILEVTDSSGKWLADLMSTDEKIAGGIDTIKNGVLVQGSQLNGTIVMDPDDSIEELTENEVTLAFAIEDHCQRCRRNVDGSWTDFHRRMMDAMRYRTMLAEQVKSIATSGPDEGLWVLDRLPVKDPEVWRFVLDRHGREIGIEADTVDDDGNTSTKILPLDHFVVLPWLPRGSNPWGQGILAEAYNHWNFKVQLYPLLWRYVEQFALPTIHATTEEGARPRQKIGTDGLPVGTEVAATVAMHGEIVAWLRKGGNVLTTPYGALIKFLNPSGNGAVFETVFNRLDSAITYAMHRTTLTIGMQGKRSNGTSDGAGQDMLGLTVSYGKSALSDMEYDYIWFPHVTQNWDIETARKFTPLTSFGQTNPEDLSRNGAAIARMYMAQLIAPEERQEALRLVLPTLGRRRRKSDKSAQLSPTPSPGSRPVNIVRRPE